MPTLEEGAPITLIAGKYDILAKFGQGSSGIVYQACNRHTNEICAVKVLQRIEPGTQLVFQQEFWAMRNLDHPGLVKAYEYGNSDGMAYFTMELIDGECLADPGTLTLGELTSILPPLTSALDYLHRQGLVHGDLKRENLRWDRQGNLRLLDLGLLGRAGLPGRQCGTLAYMAPEVIRGAPADPRSDIYAMGALLFEMLAGRPAYGGSTPLERLAVQTGGSSPVLANARPDLPEKMVLAIEACLAPDLRARPRSIGDFLSLAGLGSPTELYLVFGSSLFGRQDEVRILCSRLKERLAGTEGPVIIAGSGGSGRSRVLHEVVGRCRELGVLVVAFAGRPGGAYEFVNELAQSFRHRANSDLGPLDLLGPETTLGPPRLEPSAEIFRLRLAVAHILDQGRLAAVGESGSLLVAIDDWDQVDSASRDLLAPLMERRGMRVAWLLVRTDTSERQAGVVLESLSLGAITEMLTLALGHFPEDRLLSRIGVLSEGLPGPIRRLLKYWQENAILVPRGERWYFEDSAPGVVPPDTAHGIGRELDALAPVVRDVARTAATLGSSGAVADLLALAGDSAAPALAPLAATGFFEWNEHHWRFNRDARDLIYASTPEGLRRNLHDQVARFYAPRTDFDGEFKAVRHARLAGQDDVLPKVIGVARRCLAFGAFDAGRELLADPALQISGSEWQLDTLELLGDTARARGDVKEAMEYYEIALPIARELGNERALCRMLVSSARSAMALGRSETVSEYLAEALPLCQRLAERVQEARALMTAGRMAFFAGDRQRSQHLYQSGLDVAVSAGHRGLVADATSFLGAIGEFQVPGSLAQMEKAVEMQREIMNPLGQIEALINLGDRHFQGGQLGAAATAFEGALGIATQVGSPSEEAIARLNLAQVALERGRPHDALKLIDRAFQIGDYLQHDYVQCFAKCLAALSHLALGEYVEARAKSARAEEMAEASGNLYLQREVVYVRATVALELGDLRLAASKIEKLTQLASREPAIEVRALLLRGRFLVGIGEFSEARHILETAIHEAKGRGFEGTGLRLKLSLAYLAWREARSIDARALTHEVLAVARANGSLLIEAEASLLLGTLLNCEEAAEASQCFSHAREFASRSGLPLLQAVSELGLSTTVPGMPGHAWAIKGASRLRDLRSYAESDGFFVWPERRSAAPEGESDAGAWVNEAHGILSEARAAANLDELLRRCLERLIRICGADQGALLYFQERHLQASALVGLADISATAIPGLDEVIWGLEPRVTDNSWALPITRAQDLVAFLYLAGSALHGLGAAMALSNAIREALGLFEDLQALAKRLNCYGLVTAIAESLAKGTPTEIVFQDALSAILGGIVADRAFLLAIEPDDEVVPVAVRAVEGAIGFEYAPISRSICRHVVESRSAVSLLDAQNAAGWQSQESIATLGLRSIAAVPLQVETRLVGILYVDSGNILEGFGSEAQAILTVAGDLLAPVVDRHLSASRVATGPNRSI